MLAGVSIAAQASRRTSTNFDYAQEQAKPSIFESLRSNIPFISCSVYALWTLLGTLWYKYYMDWNFATAFYYAMEAGLSIGFCVPTEKDNYTRIFTIIYVLLGSTVVSGAIGLFFSYIFEHRASFVSQIRRKKLQRSLEYQNSKQSDTSTFVAEWERIKVFVSFGSNSTRIAVVGAFLIWMGLMTAYGVVYEGWTFITSLYWAVTTCSTGGLWSPSCITSNPSGTSCNMGILRGWIMGFFMLFGVPIYAFTVGQFAAMAVARAEKEDDDRKLAQPVTDTDFIYAANILSEAGSTTLVQGEYILLELLRLGRVRIDQIEAMKKKFYALDVKKTNVLDLEEMHIDHNFTEDEITEKSLALSSPVKEYVNRSFEINDSEEKS